MSSFIDEQLIYRQFHLTDILFYPVKTSDTVKVERMMQVINILSTTTTCVGLIIAILPFSWESEELHKISHHTLKLLNNLDFSYILIPTKNLKKVVSKCDAQSYINKLVVQAVRAPTELITCMGLPSGTSCSVDPVLSIKGRATIGVGSAYGKDRAVNAIINVLNCPSFDINNLKNAKGLVVNITCRIDDYSIDEYGQITTILSRFISREITAGSSISNAVAFNVVKGEIKDSKIEITIIATGIES